MFLNPTIHDRLTRMPPRLFHHHAVLHQGDDASAVLMSRGELSSWLAGNCLPTLAREAMRRTVPPASILGLFVLDSGPVFRVLGKGVASLRVRSPRTEPPN